RAFFVRAKRPARRICGAKWPDPPGGSTAGVGCVAVAVGRIRVEAAEEVRLTAREAWGERARLPTICQVMASTARANRAGSYRVRVLSMATRMRSHRSATLRSARA